MSFRRLPFQFSTTDPVERQRELERRFGLPSSNMYVDVMNPLSTGAVPKETNSPRLQHRVPIFVEGHDKPIKSSVDAMGSACENKKPNVRIIPIEVEGAERPSARHRTFSGPAGVPKQNSSSEIAGPPPCKYSMEDLSQPPKIKPMAEPRVHNIPIQVERPGCLKTDKTETKKASPRVNGCTVTKSPIEKKPPVKEEKVESKKEQKIESEMEQKKDSVDPVENALKKIQDVLDEFRTYEKGVQEFSGTTKDKQYRYLDEMLTRCMLKLDELDTLGNENVRCSRKSAVKQIQASVDLLESKANPATATDTEMKPVTNGKQQEVAEKLECGDVEMKDDVVPDSQVDQSSVDEEVKLPETSNEVEMNESKDSTLVNEEIKSSETEAMAGTAEVLNQVIDMVEEDDVEMQKSNSREVTVDSTTESEMFSADPVDEVEASENLTKEKSNEVPKEEMAEIQAPTVSSADGVEEMKSDGTISQDVEMRDVQDSEVNSTMLDSHCNSTESPKQGTNELNEQSDSNQAVEDHSNAGQLATDVAENCVLPSQGTDSSVVSSQN